MIIPIRCFTCGKVLADKWQTYLKLIEDKETKTPIKKQYTLNELNINSQTADKKFLEDNTYGDILNTLNIKRLCCRRMMLGHVDLINII